MNRLKRFFANINYKSLFFALLGSAIMAFGTHILADADIPEGGIIGLCLILENVWGIPTAITSLVLNGIFCLLAWRLMGTKFMANVAVATVGFSAFYALFHNNIPSFIPEDYWLLSALFGATCIEIGTGITLRFGSAPNGDHALSLALVRRGGLDFGWVNFIRDFVVIFASLVYADAYTVVFALLIMTLTTPLTEYIVKTPSIFNVKRRVYRTPSWIPRVIVGLVIVIILAGATAWLTAYSPADEEAISEFVVQGVEEVELSDGSVAFIPEGEIKAGFIFYPGGKVEHTAYAPLLKACAEKGILCISVRMPYNLAIFGINKGLNFLPQSLSRFSEIESWYIGGHSLGGSMAANCASNNPELFDGIILLASYSTNDITSFEVLSVYGSNDRVMNQNNYNKNKDNLPEKYDEYVIVGGNHAYFGMYGEQNGDGTATITNVQQITETADRIANFIFE